MLHYAGIPFEDYRIANREEWPALKQKMPFGQVRTRPPAALPPYYHTLPQAQPAPSLPNGRCH